MCSRSIISFTPSATEIIRGAVGNTEPAQEEKKVKHYGGKRPREAKLFAQNRKDRVSLRLRQVAEFLHALPETPPEYAATPERDERLLYLIGCALGILRGIDEGFHSGLEIRRKVNQGAQKHREYQPRAEKIFPRHPGNKKHGKARHRNQDKAFGVGLFEKYERNDRKHYTERQDTPLPAFYTAFGPSKPRSEINYEIKF